MGSNIRNFSIIAHVDHGKSTLSDRFISICNGLEDREMKDQVLDSMDIERERGITIKAQTVNLDYLSKDSNKYNLNLIDTPGHIDFTYEVTRSLSACEGAILLIDATQGVEAQTITNYKIAMNLGVKIIPVINKIDLPAANTQYVLNQIQNIIQIDYSKVILCSAKKGIGIIEILEAIVERIPSPKYKKKRSLDALIIDSWFDNYLGVVLLVRIFNGILHINSEIKISSSGNIHSINQLGVFTPKLKKVDSLSTGQVGFIVANIRTLRGAPVGDKIFSSLDSYKSKSFLEKPSPQIYCGIFPINNNHSELLRRSLEKLSLNDNSFTFMPETSQAKGFGFRCGFLGVLHMEITKERLEREYKVDVFVTTATVMYKVLKKSGGELEINSPFKFPDFNKIREIYEPIAEVSIVTPKKILGKIMKLCLEKRGVQEDITYSADQVLVVNKIPMVEVISDFFERLKSISQGYASFSYKSYEYKKTDVVLMDVLINGKKLDELTSIVHRKQIITKGKFLVEKIKETLPRQMFEIIVQACVGSKIISRSNIKAMRKNVLSKCYGGDVSRKKKLLQKQKDGKKNMKRLGNVHIPNSLFLSIFRTN